MSRATGSAAAVLEERLRRLSPTEFTAFCAALWDARGYDVRAEAQRLTATRDGERLRLRVVTPDWRSRVRTRLGRTQPTARSRHDPKAIDIVVAPAAGTFAERVAQQHEARLVGPAALADALLYGIPREAAATLTTRHLDIELPTLLSTATTAPSPTTGDLDWLLPGAAVVGVVCLVVAAALAGVWSPIAPTGVAPPPGVGAETTADAPSRSGVTRPASSVTDLDRTQPDGRSGEYPPGVAEGFVDPWVLAEAHARLVDDRSYRLVVRHGGTESLDDTHQWVGAWQHAVVEDDRTWLYSVVGYETAENGTELVQYTVFSDGEFAYRRTDGISGPYYDRFPVRFASPDEYGPHTDRIRRYLLRYLTTTAVTVDRPSWDPTAYRIVATGRPTNLDENVSNYTATAIVTDAGFVSELRVEYTVQTGDRSDDRRFRFEYAAVDETVLRPPSWYDDAQAATTANTTTPNAAAGEANTTATSATTANTTTA